MLHHYYIPESSAGFTSKWRQSFIVPDVDPTPMLSVKGSRWTYWTVKLVKIKSVYHIVLLHYPVWNYSPGGVGLLTRQTQPFGFSKLWRTAGSSFPCPVASSSPTKFSIKTNLVCIPKRKKKKQEKKGSKCLWCVTLWLRRDSKVASLRLDGSVVSNSERRFQSDAQNTRFPLRGKLNWLLTRHRFALASLPIGITVFPTCNGPAGQRFTLVLGATRAILDTSSSASSHMAGLGKHLGIFVSPSQ